MNAANAICRAFDKVFNKRVNAILPAMLEANVITA